MHALGFVMFLLSAPLGVAGLCDRNTTRGNVVAILGVIAAPAGLLLAAS